MYKKCLKEMIKKSISNNFKGIACICELEYSKDLDTVYFTVGMVVKSTSEFCEYKGYIGITGYVTITDIDGKHLENYIEVI